MTKRAPNFVLKLNEEGVPQFDHSAEHLGDPSAPKATETDLKIEHKVRQNLRSNGIADDRCAGPYSREGSVSIGLADYEGWQQFTVFASKDALYARAANFPDGKTETVRYELKRGSAEEQEFLFEAFVSDTTGTLKTLIAEG